MMSWLFGSTLISPSLQTNFFHFVYLSNDFTDWKSVKIVGLVCRFDRFETTYERFHLKVVKTRDVFVQKSAEIFFWDQPISVLIFELAQIVFQLVKFSFDKLCARVTVEIIQFDIFLRFWGEILRKAKLGVLVNESFDKSFSVYQNKILAIYFRCLCYEVPIEDPKA